MELMRLKDWEAKTIRRPFKTPQTVYSKEYKDFIIKRNGINGSFQLFRKDDDFNSIATFGAQWSLKEIETLIDENSF